MNDDNKKDINKSEDNKVETDNQSEVDQNDTTKDINQTSETQTSEIQPSSDNSQSNQESSAETSTETNNISPEQSDNKQEHQVIHKKDGRLHIYVRQDKYKGELKSKNWVGRLYIDGKQKISSSGTQNLDEAIPILEKWFDDIHAESERLKRQSQENQTTSNNDVQSDTTKQNETQVSTGNETQEVVAQKTTETLQTAEPIVNQSVEKKIDETSNITSENIKQENKSTTSTTKEKFSNLFGKLKNIKLKKPSLDGIKLPKSPTIKKNNALTKALDFFKTKIGKSTIQGEEIIGVELSNKSIRLAQINADKSNQWVLEKFYTHKLDIPDESSVLENAEKITAELVLAIQKSKTVTTNVAISIPVTSAIIRVVTAPLMKDDELQKAIETNSLWENLVQLTDNLDDYSIFHQVINRNQKDNTMDILFVASKLADINNYVSIVKAAGLNPVIIDVKCFALKSAVDQINQISNKSEDANLTAVLEFGLDENYLMILYDNNPIITDIFLRGQDRKILQSSQDSEEKAGLVRRYVTQVKQAVQDFETKYEKRIRNLKVVSDLDNVEEYLSFFRQSLLNVGFNLFDPIEGLKVPQQFEKDLDLPNKSYLTTSIGLAFRKLDVFGYYKFVTAAKNINLLPDRKSMVQQKKMKALSGFAFKGLAGVIAGIYLILFTLSFWNIHSYNKKLKNYADVKKTHTQKQTELKKVSKELKLMETTLQLSNSLKSNKELTYRVLAQVASSVPTRVKFDKVEYDGRNMVTIQGIAASDQDILKFIENLGKQKLIDQASLSSMKLPRATQGGAQMKGFRIFVKIKNI
jgi:type IV pilus assembly protein PilN